MRAVGVVLALLAVACSPPPPEALDVRVSCAAEGHILRQRCTVAINDRRTGRPVSGATITLAADMPSMPLAHSVRPVTARPGAKAGTYDAPLELEMTGRWVITVRIAGPTYDQVTHAIDVEPR
jgi:hypothetical protein